MQEKQETQEAQKNQVTQDNNHDMLPDSIWQRLIPLNALSAKQMQQLCLSAKVLNASGGNNFMQPGEQRDCYYYLLFGSIEIRTLSGEIFCLSHLDEKAALPFISASTQRVSVTARSDSKILQVEAKQLESLLAWGLAAKCILAEIADQATLEADYLWIKSLLESKLFLKVPPLNLQQIIQKFESVKVSKQQCIIRQGDVGDCCYFLKSGEAKVFQSDSGEQPIALLHQGDVFGEDALVNNAPRNASVIMSQDGELMRLAQQDFFSLLAKPNVNYISLNTCLHAKANNICFIDVRTEAEFNAGHYAGAIHLPLHLSFLKSAVLDSGMHYVCYSNRLDRAEMASYFLSQQGFNVRALKPGIDELRADQRQLFSTQSLITDKY
ncbi:MAG: cyclic nucleotide-binding domain-containing protein [Pseudomonadales bacterium]|nr:cyclic nucleotide-binding domain-containing protein [Pseudomonadales bacterium]